MKVKKEIVNQRRNDIMLYIQEHGEATVSELNKKFNMSELTIRRDLQYWADQHAVEKFYGGAKLIQDFIDNSSFSIKERKKHAIAKYAAHYVDDGDIIFINSSSTALLMLKYIKNKYVTIITNNGKAINVDCDPRITLIITGGKVNYPKESLVGDFALTNLENVRANKLFLGCSGFDIEQGASTAIMDEVKINRKMIERCSGAKFLLADSSKHKKIYNFKVADLNSFDYLISDHDLKHHYIEDLEALGIQTIQLDPL